MSVNGSLSRKTVIITGGSRGIGAAAVRSMHAAGASVLFTYLTSADAASALCDELGPRVAAVRCDLGDRTAPPGVIDACLASFGPPDVLVNNAAVFVVNRFDGDDYDVWRACWERTFAINLFGCADLAWLAMRHMRARGGGRIINVASRAAHRGELECPDYGASKAALVNLTKSIARACAGDGVTAVAVAPGFVETEMAAYDLSRERARIVGDIPLGRVGTPEEIAAFITFLASPDAVYANGATIDLNGASYVR